MRAAEGWENRIRTRELYRLRLVDRTSVPCASLFQLLTGLGDTEPRLSDLDLVQASPPAKIRMMAAREVSRTAWPMFGNSQTDQSLSEATGRSEDRWAPRRR